MTPRAVEHALLHLLGSRGGLLTAGEAAIRCGCPLEQVESALLRLAVAGGADLRVAQDGTVAYRFGPHLRRRLLARSWRLRLEAACGWWWQRLFALIRLSFGLVLVVLVALLSLIVLVVVAVQILRSDDGGEELLQVLWGGLELLVRVLLLLVSDGFSEPGGTPAAARRSGRGGGTAQGGWSPRGEKRLAFFEATSSLLFGDGDPNRGLEQRRWIRIGCFLQHRGGAVIAEDLAPLLDLPLRPEQAEQAAMTADAAMLEVLQHFDGRPAVSAEGDLAYHFPGLQVRAGRGGSLPDPAALRPAPPLRERVIPFSRTTRRQRQIYGGLCAALLLLSTLLLALVQPAPTALLALALFAMVYGLLLIAIPLVRLQVVRRRNHGITVRNDRRRSWTRGGPGLSVSLQRKRRFSQALALHRGFSAEGALAYTTETDLLSQQIAGGASVQTSSDARPC